MSPPTLTICLICSMVYFLDNGVSLKSKYPPTEVKFPRNLISCSYYLGYVNLKFTSNLCNNS